MFLYCWLKKLRNQPSQILLSLVVALFFGQLLFFFGFNFTKSKTICIFIASVTHYFFLVAFFCMNVMGFDLCRTFFNSVPMSRNHNRSLISLQQKPIRLLRFKLYSYYSWGLPLALVVLAHLLDHVERWVMLFLSNAPLF